MKLGSSLSQRKERKTGFEYSFFKDSLGSVTNEGGNSAGRTLSLSLKGQLQKEEGNRVSFDDEVPDHSKRHHTHVRSS